MSLTVEKALQLLHVLADSETPLGISEVARLLQMPKATAFRLASTLEEHGFIHKDATTMRYGLGLQLWELGRRAVLRLDMRPIARSYLQTLTEQTGETSLFVITDSSSVVYLESVNSSQAIQVNAHALGVTPLHASAAGKIFLAHHSQLLKKLWRQDSLAKYTNYTITDRKALEAELEQVRQQGWATSIREWRSEMSSVAVPVWNAGSELVGGIVVSAPAERLEGDRLGEVLNQVLMAAHQMSRNLGHQVQASDKTKEPRGDRRDAQ